MERVPNDSRIKSISFACGGWLQFYLFGVGKAFQDHGLDENITFLGTSAGALAAACICLKGSFDHAIHFAKEHCVPKAYQSFSGLFRVGEFVSNCLDSNDELSKWRNLSPGQLQIAITRLPYLNAERVTAFES